MIEAYIIIQIWVWSTGLCGLIAFVASQAENRKALLITVGLNYLFSIIALCACAFIALFYKFPTVFALMVLFTLIFSMIQGRTKARIILVTLIISIINSFV